jgi:hypothetical protein
MKFNSLFNYVLCSNVNNQLQSQHENSSSSTTAHEIINKKQQKINKYKENYSVLNV